MTEFTIVGGSVAGLAAGLMLARGGHQVTVLERDGRRMPAVTARVDSWPRPTVPQYHHAHAIPALGRQVLRAELPDVYRELLRRGAREFPYATAIPARAAGADTVDPATLTDLVSLGCRRSLFEWVLRQAAYAQPGLSFRSGVVVTGVDWADGPVPRAVGLRTRSHGRLPVEVVVDASGRRSRLPQWLIEGGIEPREENFDSELVAHTRFFQLRDPAHPPTMRVAHATPVPLDGCAAFAFLADSGIFSVVIGRHPHDIGLVGVREVDTFDRVVRAVPALAPLLDPALAVPISGVSVMAGIKSSYRHLTDGLAPVATGLVAIGDALSSTNPIFGRGMGLALRHGELLARAADRSEDAEVLSANAVRRLDEYSWPTWYDSYRHDVDRTRAWRAALGLPQWAVPDDVRPHLPYPLAAAASRVDARMFVRLWRAQHLLDDPDDLYEDAELIQRLPREITPPRPPIRHADLVEVARSGDRYGAGEARFGIARQRGLSA